VARGLVRLLGRGERVGSRVGNVGRHRVGPGERTAAGGHFWLGEIFDVDVRQLGITDVDRLRRRREIGIEALFGVRFLLGILLGLPVGLRVRLVPDVDDIRLLLAAGL